MYKKLNLNFFVIKLLHFFFLLLNLFKEIMSLDKLLLEDGNRKFSFGT